VTVGSARSAHRSLLARREGRPASAGAGPAEGCRRRGAQGKSDASRARGTAPDRPAGDHGDRGAPRGSAGGAGRRRGESGRGLPADTGGCNRRGRDHRRDRERRAAGRGGTPASGGSPRPRGPGEVRRAVDKNAGVCDNRVKPLTPPRGGCARGSGGTSSRPSSFSLRGRGSLPENPSSFHSQRQSVRISTVLDERQHVAECPALKACYTQGRTYEEAIKNIRDVITLCLADLKARGAEIPRQAEIIGVKRIEVAA